QVLYLLANTAVVQVALRLAVAAERVEIDRERHLEDLAGVADNEDRADGMPLAALPADLARQVHHQPQRFERAERLEFAQLARVQPLEVLVEVHDAEAVDRLGRAVDEIDAVVQDDDVRTGPDLFVGNGVQESGAHALLDRHWLRVEFEDDA